jgi:hypothetical protein
MSDVSRSHSWSALGRIRTCDTCLRRAVLYPLSYEGPSLGDSESLAHRQRPLRAGSSTSESPGQSYEVDRFGEASLAWEAHPKELTWPSPSR